MLTIGVLPFALNGLYNKALADHARLFWLVDVTTWVALPSAIVAVALKRRVFQWADLGFIDQTQGKRQDWILIVTFLVGIPLLFWSDSASRTFAVQLFGRNYFAVGFDYVQMIPPPGPATGWYRILAIVYLALSAGVVEELYFRGMLRLLFGRGPVQVVLYVVCSSLLFSSTHWKSGIYTMSEALGFGLCAAGIFACTRNIWPLIVGHFLVDLRYFWS